MPTPGSHDETRCDTPVERIGWEPGAGRRRARRGAMVVGVDGCRGGWVAARIEGRGPPRIELYRSFAEVLAAYPPPAVVAVDIPIGLPARPIPGGRECDRAARRLLGPRASSVFSPPVRRLLRATHYEEIRGHGLTIQAFHLFPKIREVDALMSPRLQEYVRETHPELALTSLMGQPPRHPKRTAAGRRERLGALRSWGGPPFARASAVLRAAISRFLRAEVAPDDVVDAMVLAWAAGRMRRGEALRLPAQPPRDRRGLRMEIWG